MTKTFEDVDLNQIRNVVGVDLGVNFIATAYDSRGITTFFRGRWIKDRKAHFQRIRKFLQKRGNKAAPQELQDDRFPRVFVKQLYIDSQASKEASDREMQRDHSPVFGGI